MIASAIDIGDTASIEACYQSAVYAFGGIDVIALTAGIFLAPNVEGNFLLNNGSWFSGLIQSALT